MNSVKAGSIVVGAMGVTVVFATANNLLTTNKRAPATLIPLGGVLATLGLLGAASVVPDAAAMMDVGIVGHTAPCLAWKCMNIGIF